MSVALHVIGLGTRLTRPLEISDERHALPVSIQGEATGWNFEMVCLFWSSGQGQTRQSD